MRVVCNDLPGTISYPRSRMSAHNYASPQLREPFAMTTHPLNPQPSTLNPQPSTRNPHPSTLNPECYRLPSQIGYLFFSLDSARKHPVFDGWMGIQ